MPAKTGKQYRFMQAVAHGSSNKVDGGPSKAVAKEFIKKTSKEKRKEFSRGK